MVLKNSEIYKLSDMYQYQVCLFIDNFINKKLPRSFDGMSHFNSDIQDDPVTRQSSYMKVHPCNSALSNKLPSFNFTIISNN